MLDVKLIRERTEWVEERLSSRGKGHDLSAFRQLEGEKRALQQETEALQARRNALSRRIGLLKKQPVEANRSQELIAFLENVEEGKTEEELDLEVKTIGPRLKALEERLKGMESEVEAVLSGLPNLPHESVPVGADETANVEMHRWGQPRDFDFPVQAHWDVGTSLGILDFDAGAKLSGARFTVLRGGGARLSRALISLMLDIHTREHGYTEILPPFMVSETTLYGTGQLPKFREELYATQDDLLLIPTAEVPVTNLVRDEIVDASTLPLKYTAWTPCFRREAGAAGQDTRGLIRQHQFDKVELVQITAPEKSYEALEELTGHAENILKRLELPFRRIVLCTGDMGFGAAKTYDLEVWLPAQGRYREISSCSNCESFQARRMKARLRRGEGAKPELLHTLNGSGLAVGRTLVAILENYQQADGSVVIPDALRPYMGGEARIS
ncbi:MAG: serine--tRNA ligase [Magnetococcales bacterium]|nr:serine--tRNA ligase [Magnetococcales bacterium]